MKKLKELILKLSIYISPIICGFLGAWGGAEGTSKNWRRILIPIIITGIAFLDTESILTITIMSMCGFLSMGYGIPGNNDSGSTLGKFWYNLLNQNYLLADICTRGTIGLLISLSMISIPIIKKNWQTYILCSLGIIFINALMSWRNLGTYNLFHKELSWVETLTWGLITLFAMLMIYGGNK